MKRLVAIAMTALCATAQAATYYVTPSGTGDGSDWNHAASLSSAAAQADATELKLLAGDYPLAAQMTFTSGRNVRIAGGYTGEGDVRGTEKSVIYRDPSVEAMRLLEGTSATLALEGLAFTNGFFKAANYGLAAKFASCTVSMTDCEVRNNGPTYGCSTTIMAQGSYYGCIYVSGGSFAATNTVFADNYFSSYYDSSHFLGIGLSCESSARVSLEDCTFYRNRGHLQHHSHSGMGAYFYNCYVTMRGCTFRENFCRRQENYAHNDAYGGAFYYYGDGRTLLVEDSLFAGNWMNDTGASSYGTVYIKAYNSCQPTFVRCVFTGNGVRNPDDPAAEAASARVTDKGQCYFYSRDKPLLFTNCAFVDTRNDYPSLVFDGGAGATLHRCTVANGGGYGIEFRTGTLTLTDSIVWGNANGDILQAAGTTLVTSYCDLQTRVRAPTDVSVDPVFSSDGYAHLLSEAGYYADGGFAGGSWTVSLSTSPLIDGGDPDLSYDDETQPNGHRANIGAYAGTAVATRSKLGSSPLVRDDELKVFAYDVTPLLGGGSIRGTVASTGGGADPTVYAVWDSTDHGMASALADWANAVEVGTPARWELFTKVMTPVSGLTYCRLIATNEKGTAVSNPALAFTPAELPTLSDAAIVRTSRKLVTVTATLQADGGSPTSVRVRSWPDAAPGTVTTNWCNGGYAVDVGTVCDFKVDGLLPATDYRIVVDAVNLAGVAETPFAVTTLSDAEPIVRYVTPTGAGAKNGVSWGNAYARMQEALEECYVAGDVVYVREGDYEHYGYEVASDPSAMAVESAAGLAIRGGYAGSGAPGEKGLGRTVFRQATDATWTQGNRRHLRILDSTVTVDGVDFDHGALPAVSANGEDRYGNAVSAKNSYLSFADCGFFENGFVNHDDGSRTPHYGGAVALRTGTLAVTNCAFLGNQFSCASNDGGNAYGGALYANKAATTVSGCTFVSNRVATVHCWTEGGAIYCDGAGGTLAIDHTTFATNWNKALENYGADRMKGGSITVSGLDRFDMSDCTFLGGWVNSYRGAVPKCTGQGGAINVISTPATITRTVFRDMGQRSGAYANDSGGVTLTSGSLALKNVLFAGVKGNALDALAGTVTADCCTFVGATQYGFYQNKASSVSFSHCIFRENAAGDYFFNDGADATFSYCYTQTEKEGDANTTADPLLADLVHCHPKSVAGHYEGGWFADGAWVTTDTETSPTIDTGDVRRAAEGEGEAKPNGHLLNIGYDAGTETASKSVLGDNPVVDPNVLNVFAYSATGVSKTSATMRGEVASVANQGKVTVTVYWGETDCGKTATGWDGSAVVGQYDAWEQFSYVLNAPISGRFYYRFRIENGAGEAWTGPEQSFESVDAPTVTLDGITHVTRHTAKVSGTLVTDGHSPTTAKVIVTLGQEETEYPVNDGVTIASGTSFSVDLADLVTNTTYGVRLEATNSGGTTTLSETFTTLTTNAIVRYVVPEGAGIRDGLSWASAYADLQEAILACCCAGDVICLKEGVYTSLGYSNADDPTMGCIEDAAGLTLRGGYAGEGEPGAKGTGKSVFRREASSGIRRVLRIEDSTVAFEDIAVEGGRLGEQTYGHGVYAKNSALSFVRCNFRDNGMTINGNVARFGGALSAEGGSAAFTNCTFADNMILADEGRGTNGGALWTKNVALELVGCLFSTNYVNVGYVNGSGGAVYATGGSALVADCVFNGNYITRYRTYSNGMHCRGGALCFDAVPRASVTGCVFDGNYACDSQNPAVDRAGGTLFCAGAAGMTKMSHCLVRRAGISGFTTNTDRDCGGVTIEAGSLAIDNTLFDGGHSNSVEVTGGTLAMTNVTIVGNDANGLRVWGGTVTVKNSILWGNCCDAAGAFTATYSDIQGAAADEGAHVMSVDPLLYGPTKKRAHHLRAGSPCAGKGDATGWTAADTDLDGQPRLRGGKVDLGCYSFNAPGLMLMLK